MHKGMLTDTPPPAEPSPLPASAGVLRGWPLAATRRLSAASLSAGVLLAPSLLAAPSEVPSLALFAAASAIPSK
jgi:hypothetical protein